MKYTAIRTRKDFRVTQDERRTPWRVSPERYATTGLDWSNRAHHEAIANGLFQTLMGLLARQQGLRGYLDREELRRQQTRVEQRLSVIERAIWRKGGHLPRRIDDGPVVHGLEKMADAFEEGAAAWRKAKEENGSNVLAGTMLGVGVGMASDVRKQGGLNRFSVGPFAGLSCIAALVTCFDFALEMEDLPALNDLVDQARGIPVGQALTNGIDACAIFNEACGSLQGKLQKRVEERIHGH